MKLCITVFLGIILIGSANGKTEKDENVLVYCEPIKSEKVKLMRCESFDATSLKSIDTWIATIP